MANFSFEDALRPAQPKGFSFEEALQPPTVKPASAPAPAPAPVAAAPTPAAAPSSAETPKVRFVPAAEPFVEKTQNPFKGLVGRAAELVGSGIDAVAEVGERLGDKLELTMPLSGLTPEQVKSEQQLKPKEAS